MEHKWQSPDYPALPPENIHRRQRPDTFLGRVHTLPEPLREARGARSNYRLLRRPLYGTSRSFPQYVIAVENYGPGKSSATVNTCDQLTQRGKPPRPHVNSWLRDGH